MDVRLFSERTLEVKFDGLPEMYYGVSDRAWYTQETQSVRQRKSHSMFMMSFMLELDQNLYKTYGRYKGL